MREPDVYKPPLEAAEKGRNRAGNVHGAFLLAAAMVIVAIFLAGTWQPPRWTVMALVGVLGILGTITVGCLVHALDDLRCHYRQLLDDYKDAHYFETKRAKFMIEFRPARDFVWSALRAAAYSILPYHEAIVALHAGGVGAVYDTLSPDDERSVLTERFREAVDTNERYLRTNLERFRQLRDLAREFDYKDLPDSWKDYIAPLDLTPSSRGGRAGKGKPDRRPDDPIITDCPPGPIEGTGGRQETP